MSRSGAALESSADLDDDDIVPETALIRYRSMRGLTLSFVLLGVMMHTIDSTIANIALPYMQGSMSATLDQIAWIVTSYILATAVVTPAVAWLSDRFGLRRVLLVSVLGFTAASVLCGMAVSLTDMVVYRFIQGASGAALIPIGQLIVVSCYPRTQTAKAMAVFGLGVMLGPILGPTLGGYITEMFDWRWVFFVNVPVGLIAAAGIAALVKDAPKTTTNHFDGFGFFSLIISLIFLQLIMDQGHGEDWFESNLIVVWTLLSAIALYLFIVRTITAEHPFFDRELFKDRDFMASNLMFFIVMGNMVATMVMLPPLIQSVMGYPAFEAGLLLVPRGVGTMIGMVFAPRLFARIDPRFPILLGMAITVFALLDQAQVSIYYGAADIVRSGFFHGLGLGILFVQIGALTYRTIPDRLRLQASAFFNAMRNVGGAFCASLSMAVLSSNIQINMSELGEHINPLRKGLDLLVPLTPGESIAPEVYAIAQAAIAQQAALISYGNNFLAIAIVSAMSMVFLLLVKPPPDG